MSATGLLILGLQIFFATSEATEMLLALATT